MTRAASRTVKLICALLTCVTALSLVACGGGEPEPATPIMISQAARPDHLDPALSSRLSGLEALWLVYTPLLTYRHASGQKGAELIPGLASDLPEISADGLTYTLTLREGLKYSDGTQVRASDFEHALARTLFLGSPGARFYEPIVGASEFVAAGDPQASIAGIESDEQTGEITIKLTRPDPTFADALALPYAAPVPARTSFRDLGASPPPGVGPYELTDVDADDGFALKRSQSFAGLDIPDIPTGNVGRITSRTVPGGLRQAQDVLDGKLDYMQDQPPAELRPTIAEQASDRFTEHPTASTLYAYFDRRRPPFSDPAVREAVNRGIDRTQLADLSGSLQPGCALLAPGVPGYSEALDTTECPYGNPSEAPKIATAKALIDQAHATGTEVSVAPGDPAARALTAAYVKTLDEIGLRARIERRRPAQTGLRTVAPPFPRALGFFAGPGRDDPLIAGELERLAAGMAPGAEADAWRALDLYAVSPPQSYVAAVGHPTAPTFFSERMDPESAIYHPVFGNDYSSWQLKEGE